MGSIVPADYRSDPMIRPSAVIWDMGGVMYPFFTELLVAYGHDRGWPLERLLTGPTGPAFDADYAAMDRGEITEPEYTRRLLAALNRESIALDPYTDLDFTKIRRTATWALIEQISGIDLRQMILTNDASVWLGECWWETWEHLHLFESIIDVKTIGVRKPAPEPYLACTEALNLPPGECLFIDDMRVNCLGAENVGMHSHWFDITNPVGSVATLRKRLDL
jgi:putative hydrolase of the HAD superfamily